jgi:mRNA-degrading endonuclease RelE of RelBE toxin-antitoxin system
VTWQIEWSERAVKDARALDRQVWLRVARAINRLAETGHGDLIRLKGTDDELRLRVGAWRVRLLLDHTTQTIKVERVLPRGRAYRD